MMKIFPVGLWLEEDDVRYFLNDYVRIQKDAEKRGFSLSDFDCSFNVYLEWLLCIYSYEVMEVLKKMHRKRE